MIPKARVVFKKTDISLDEEFVEKIEDACNKNDIAELLNLIEAGMVSSVPLSALLRVDESGIISWVQNGSQPVGV